MAYIEQELAMYCADRLIWECMLQTVQAKLMEIMSVGFFNLISQENRPYTSTLAECIVSKEVVS